MKTLTYQTFSFDIDNDGHSDWSWLWYAFLQYISENSLGWHVYIAFWNRSNSHSFAHKICIEIPWRASIWDKRLFWSSYPKTSFSFMFMASYFDMMQMYVYGAGGHKAKMKRPETYWCNAIGRLIPLFLGIILFTHIIGYVNAVW